MRHLKHLFEDKSGVTAVEYGLILALVFLAMIVAVRGVASDTIQMWNNVSNTVNQN